MTEMIELPLSVAEGFVANSNAACYGMKVTNGIETETLRVVQFYSDDLPAERRDFVEEVYKRTAHAVGTAFDKKIEYDKDFVQWNDVAYVIRGAKQAVTKDVSDLNVGGVEVPEDMTAIVTDIELGYRFVVTAKWTGSEGDKS